MCHNYGTPLPYSRPRAINPRLDLLGADQGVGWAKVVFETELDIFRSGLEAKREVDRAGSEGVKVIVGWLIPRRRRYENPFPIFHSVPNS